MAQEPWLYYMSIYLPSISYSLPTTTFSQSQLQTIQSKTSSILVPMLCFNCYTPLPMVYDPSSHGGLGLRHLYSEQGLGQLQLFMKYWRNDCQAGTLLKIVLSWAQFNAGVSWSILEYPFIELPHWESLWLKSLVTFLRESNAYLIIDDKSIQPIQ